MAVEAERRGYGDLVQTILDVVARSGAAMTPRQAQQELGGDLAYTTVMTVMARLHERGLLTRARIGRAFAYTAVTNPAHIAARRMHRLLDVEKDRAGVLASFVDELNPADESVLRALLEQITTHQDQCPEGQL